MRIDDQFKITNIDSSQERFAGGIGGDDINEKIFIG